MNIHNYPAIGFDTETTGLRYPVDRVFGMSVATPDESLYVDVRAEPDRAATLVRDLQGYRGAIACHNVSFDYRMMLASGWRLPLERMDDTVIRAAQIDEHLPTYELDYLAKKYLHRTKDTTIYQAMAELFGGLPTRNVQIGRIADAPPEVVAPYGALDAELCLALWFWQQAEIERQGIERICEFERSLIPEFVNNEIQGIRVDVAAAEKAAEEINAQIPGYAAELNAIFGQPVNPDSSPQIKKLFAPIETDHGWEVEFEGVRYSIGTTPKGGPSLAAPYMHALASAGNHAAKLIIELRSLRKTADTFLLGHVVGHAHNGRVYPNINQTKGEEGGVYTGRLSYTNPALQQIPSRNKRVAAIVKQTFLPEEEHVWVDYDLDGFEVAVFAHLINNEQLTFAFQNNHNLDFHQYVADLVGLPRNPPRAGVPNGKQLNLSMIFCQGEGSTSEAMGYGFEWDSFENSKGETITYKRPMPEGKAKIEEYHRKVPGVRELIKKCKSTALQYGYICTREGRRMRFPGKRNAYKASGLLIQATSADINKHNWVRIREVLEPLGGRLLLNTHDSYGTSVPMDMVERSKILVKEAVESAAGLRVPLRLSCSGHGATWWDAVKGDD